MSLDFAYFLGTKLRSLWIREPGIDIYVRRSVRLGVEIDIATINADEPGKGAFTRFLDKYEPHHIFYVECIHEPRLVPYLARRGYQIVNSSEFETNMKGPAKLYRGSGLP